LQLFGIKIWLKMTLISTCVYFDFFRSSESKTAQNKKKRLIYPHFAVDRLSQNLVWQFNIALTGFKFFSVQEFKSIEKSV